jgi:hypothetical protein
LLFISVTALAASSGDEKHTNPKPLEVPEAGSRMMRAEVIVPNSAKCSRN